MLSPSALERFEVRSQLGAGSFGTVYEALDRQRNRTVALKVLERVAPDTVARFKREFRTLAELRHPNLARLYELIVLGGQWLLTMELVRGSELLEHLAFVELQHSFVQDRIPTLTDFDGDQTMILTRPAAKKVSPLYIQHIRATFQQLAVALSVLHAHGVVHRDIKPSNIMIARDGRVVVLDFGLAVEESLDDTLDRRQVVGTPGYMSPEQIAAAAPTAASDWYSFGVLLFQALTGKMPFEGETAMDVVHNQLHAEAPDARDVVRGVPDDLAALALACLERDPLQRPSDMEVIERMGVRDFDPVRSERTRERATELVGRGRELRTLRTWLDALKPGEGRIILIEGSPGVGKTALLDRFLDAVRAAGDTLILAGRCQPWESLPFNAVDAIVDALARELRRS
ncbi:MAG TPA: serine/threonine-protein kinase, partial [Thermoanaerobaculia bacterium]|nr:serine/threonine-protein kinase [Thermoanaerobaculia bacterium]